MNVERTIRWGIIGCGNVTEVKSGPAFQNARNSALVAVMRRDAAKAANYASRHGVPRSYDDAAKLIADPEVDAVYIAAPPNMHEYYTHLVAAAGKPVYVEKPMGRSFDECRRMIAACERARAPLFVAYYRRCLPRFLKLKQLIDAGAIGDIRLVTVTLYQPAAAADKERNNLPWRVLPEIGGAGKFLDLASHTLDLLDYLISPVRRANGYSANQGGLYPAEDIVCAALEFESGALGNGVWCFTACQHLDQNVIVGSSGTLRFSTFGDEPIRLQSDAQIEEFAIRNPPHIQQPLIQSVIDHLNQCSTCPSTGHSAARTNRVMDMILHDWRMAGYEPQA